MAPAGVDERCDVLVLGAGAAGVGAARRLLEEDGGAAAGGGAASRSGGAGLKVVVLEARDRVGGRAWTSDELRCGLDLDHGGKWIHGSSSPENPMTELAARHGIRTTGWSRTKRRRNGNMKRVVIATPGGNGESHRSVVPSRQAENASRMLYKRLCRLGPDSLIAPLRDGLPTEATYKDCLVEIASREMPGKSFAEWLETKTRNTLIAAGNPAEKVTTPLVAETIALLRHRVYWELENYEGCRLDQCSLHHAMSGTILPGENADVAGGYGKLVETLATGVPMDVRFGRRVLSIDRRCTTENGDDDPQGVAVVCAVGGDGPGSKERFVARLGCVVALPLGVLQSSVADPGVKDPLFIPPLPKSLLGAIHRLGMCLMNKVEVLFPRRWWPKGTGTLEIASGGGDADGFPLGDMPWSHWIVEEDDPPVLVCYATGAFAERIEAMADGDVGREGAAALRRAFPDDGAGGRGARVAAVPDPAGTHVTRWRSDPFARGSWTFFEAGTRGMKDVRAFRRFNSKRGSGERLYFAGEHTCGGSVDGLDIGTVHGAYLSGTLAAEELLEQSCTKKIDK